MIWRQKQLMSGRSWLGLIRKSHLYPCPFQSSLCAQYPSFCGCHSILLLGWACNMRSSCFKNMINSIIPACKIICKQYTLGSLYFQLPYIHKIINGNITFCHGFFSGVCECICIIQHNLYQQQQLKLFKCSLIL